ncbi:hypothetical protein DFH09DRAFT_1276514 [Mycena vulgaris]|nr:hypothetical protein DFH09DRAFT_1276514 [Mycena vulgaris]
MNNKRKSMRHAADPCLGFYSPTSEPTLPPSPVPDVSPIETIGFDDHRSSDDGSFEQAMTVDAFLRRSVLASTKNYGKKSRRRGNRDGSLPREASTNTTDYDEEISPIASHRRINPTHRQFKPLKKRLLNAAVLSHADPGEWLLEEEYVPHTRNPLPFVERHSPSQHIKTKRRTWSLVDPRKPLPPGPNSFSTRKKTYPGNTPKKDTLSGWQARIYLDGAAIHKRRDRKAPKRIQVPLKCLPLSFVALHEAGRSYSLMRVPRMPAQIPKPRIIVIESTTSRVALDFSSVNPQASSPQASCQIAQGISQPELQPPSCLPVAAMPTLPDLPTPAHADDHTPLAPILSSLSNSLSVCALTNGAAIASLPPSRVSPQITKNTLKPLASFLDQFLQIAQSETQLERSKKKVPGKVGSNQMNAPKSTSTSILNSFLRSSVRPTSSARRTAPPSHSRPFPPFPTAVLTSKPNGLHPAFPPSIAPPFRFPSTPDVHSALHTPYQVVLPSTPPNSRDYPTPYLNDGIDVDMAMDTLDSSVNLFCFNARV